MTVSTQPARAALSSGSRLRGWRPVAAVITLAAGAAVIIGAFLPWVEIFAGLIPVPGVRGTNGKVIAAAGAVIVAAGIWQLASGGQAARWLAGLAGFAASAFSGYLLIQLTATMRVLGGESMVAARSGPGLAVTTAGSVLAFATLLLPPSSQTTLRRERGAGAAPQAAQARAGTDGGATALAARLPALGGARRLLQLALGVLWLLDAALQYQPAMFTKAFVTTMLTPAAAGQPAFIAAPMHLLAHVVAASPAGWNAAFATIQLALGAGLLLRATTRAALAGTIAWSLSVWWLGEGLGGIFTGTASPLAGAPGAAVLYALLAVLAWPPSSPAPSRAGTDAAGAGSGLRSVAESGPLGRRYARLAWLGLWAVMAVLMAVAPLRASSLTAGGGMTAVGLTAAFTAAFAFAAVGVLFPRTSRAALITAVIAAVIIWTAGEDLGGILSGMATDPNSGPLLVLIALAFWPVRQAPAASVRYWPSLTAVTLAGGVKSPVRLRSPGGGSRSTRPWS
jgi:hypothetical protein